jgi:heterodisulfide reductase subunit A
VAGLDPSIRQFHVYRDMRTYGKFEPLYTEARDTGSVFVKFDEDAPPSVATTADGRLVVNVQDLLTERTELAIPVDLVVLVTGMVPRENGQLVDVLKLPAGTDGFFNEIHPKLRPVETVVDGVLIAGTCQGPKTSAESVTSALAAVTQSAAILKKGFTELDPLVAIVDPDACTACGACLTACPYDAISMAEGADRHVAVISPTGCKGCGGCVPMCPEDAIDLLGYTDAEITSMIESLAEVPV